MKKILLIVFVLFNMLNGFAQNLKNEKITILKGGITVLQFSGDITSFKLKDKDDYNINIEEDKSIRIWAKAGVVSPVPTQLTITEGTRNHQFNIQYKEKGDYNSTYYDYTFIQKNTSTNEVSNSNTNTSINTTYSSIDKKKIEERAKVLAEEKRKRDERAQIEIKKLNDANAKIKEENEKKLTDENEQRLIAERKKIENKERFLTEEKIKKELLEQKILSERKVQQELEAQIDFERKEKQLKEAQLLAEKSKKQKESELMRLAKAEEINAANLKKAREENERRLQQEKQIQNEKLRALNEEKEKRDAILESIEEEKRQQEILDQRIAEEKRIREIKLETERKVNEARQIAEEKRKIIQEIEETKKAEAARIAAEKRLREESELRILAEKQKQQEAIIALEKAKKEQQELMKLLQAEKEQRNSLEQQLISEKQKRAQKELLLEKEKLVTNAPIVIPKPISQINPNNTTTIESNISKVSETKTDTDLVTNTDNYTFTANENNLTSVNFSPIPHGQLFDKSLLTDTTELALNAAKLNLKEPNPAFVNATTQIDEVRLSLANIEVENGIAYIHFKIENLAPEYFILGTTQLKVLDAETGKKMQINPYYVSSFPIVESATTANVVYAMKAEKNFSPNSFIMVTLRERQTNKKYELNFPGNLYTEVIFKK